MKHFIMALVAAALCFLGVVLSAPKVSAATLDDTISGGVSYQYAYDWAYSNQVPGVTITDNIVIFPVHNFVNNGAGAFYIYFLANTISDVNLSADGSLYCTSSILCGGYILYKSTASSWDCQGSTSTGSQYIYFRDLTSVYSNNVSFYFNGESAIVPSPSWTSPDSFYVRPEGWYITYLALPGSDSPRGNFNFISTLEYYVKITFDRNDINSYSVIVPSNPYWQVYPKTLNTVTDGYIAQNIPNFTLSNRYKTVKYYHDPYLVPSESDLAISSDWLSPQDLWKIHIDDLLKLFQETHPDNAIAKNDLLNVLHVDFIDAASDNIAFTYDVDYSSFHNTDPYIPPKSASSQPDPTVDPDEQNNNEVLDYLQGLLGGAEGTFRSAPVIDYSEDFTPELNQFDFTFSFDTQMSDASGFVRTLFEKIVAAAGLSGFLSIVIAIAISSWFIFGRLR